MPVHAHARLALIAAVLAACGTDASDDSDTAVGQVASAFDASGDLARLLVPLEATAGLDGMTQADARNTQIAAARSAFEGLVPLLQRACVTTTSTPTSVSVTFDQCRIFLGAFVLDGSLVATIDIVVDGATPVAVSTTVSSPGLTLVGPLHARGLSGDFELVQPISAAAAPVHFEGMVAFTIDGEPSIRLSATADWTVQRGNGGDGDCVELDGGAELAGDALGALSPIALSGQGIAGCRNACPSAGTVQVSFGQGSLLRWSYTGADTAIVTGPRGRSFEVALPCGDM